MAPTPISHLLDHPLSRHLHHFHRRSLSFPRHPPRRLSPLWTDQPTARNLDTAPQPPVIPEGPPPPPIVPAPSGSIPLAPEPSTITVNNNQPQGSIQPADIPGNVVAAVVVIVLILGGLIGLVVGGETLRRRTRIREKRVPPPPSRRSGRWKSEPIKKTTSSPQRDNSSEKYNEKTLTPPARPPPVLSRERQRGLSDVWPIRSLSRAMCNRRSCPEQVGPSLQCSPPTPSPQTTWSEFSPVSLYVAPPRTVLTSIPEELEDCGSQSNNLTTTPGVTQVQVQRSSEPGLVVPTPNERNSLHIILLDGFSEPKSSSAAERCGPQDRQIMYKTAPVAKDEDAKSLGSSAPDMISDGGDSSRSSVVSLESLGDGSDRESLREEVFELRRAQTTSMQMNKGVLLSLSLKTMDDSQNPGSAHGECSPSQSLSTLDGEGGKDYIEGGLSLAMLGANFSAVDLDEFPSPPSILPMIPSFVSGF